jgi:sulfur carrier protein
MLEWPLFSRTTAGFPMQLSLNGQQREFPDGLTVAGLIEHLELTGKRVALERNGDIVPKSQHASTLLAHGDVLEMVVAVGGG